MARIDICKTCKKEFEHKCHARRYYCGKSCKNNGEWGKINKTLNVGRKSTKETRMKRSKISKELKTWKVLFQPEIREKAMKNSIEKRKNGTSRKGKSATWMLGENNPNWKGGVGTERHRLMGQVDYVLWRTAVFMRDDYTCQQCNIRGGSLEADHIKPWALYPELRYAIDNGRTLCVDCHRQTDTWGRKSMYRKEGA